MLFAPTTDLETAKSEPDLAEAPKAGQGSGSSRWFPLDLEDYTRPPLLQLVLHTQVLVLLLLLESGDLLHSLLKPEFKHGSLQQSSPTTTLTFTNTAKYHNFFLLSSTVLLIRE